ncbi:DUF2231 domain-containing protein [Microbispora bryophytorum]|uniref:DUF2231 domain-containing protein n=1 Tax=Microbispora bryophytorum subsp. camponoti TaxID=1677852 RepID=A0ABR8L2C8_9ACTN|nr:DUF2231 domain-containing protein [Microbispora camponoti]MBD3145117.1 DUF2231 domain-containing protein [Microbispora camponoti]
MTGELHDAKRPVSAALAGPYGHPFHPMLVAVPIGAWVASMVFDLASRFAPGPGFLAEGSKWLIALGVLGALAAAMAGFLDLFAIPVGTPAFRTGLLHMGLNLVITAAYAAGFLWRQAGTASDTGASTGAGAMADAGADTAAGAAASAAAGPVPLGPLLLSAISLALLVVSGYLGGKLAYRYGVRVADEVTQADGFRR